MIVHDQPVDHEDSGRSRLGGFFTRLINKTGAPSVIGTVVRASKLHAEAFELAGAQEYDMIGIVAELGKKDGEMCSVCVSGKVYVLLKDGTGDDGELGAHLQQRGSSSRCYVSRCSSCPPQLCAGRDTARTRVRTGDSGAWCKCRLQDSDAR